MESTKMKNTITSLYVTGIHVGTDEPYIRKIFTKLGRVHKVKYDGGLTAHVHMKHWWKNNDKIQALADKIETGQIVPLIHDVIYYWNVGLFNPDGLKTKQKVGMKELLEFTQKFGIQLNPDANSDLADDKETAMNEKCSDCMEDL